VVRCESATSIDADLIEHPLRELGDFVRYNTDHRQQRLDQTGECDLSGGQFANPVSPVTAALPTRSVL
jgi:hypothetical protein